METFIGYKNDRNFVEAIKTKLLDGALLNDYFSRLIIRGRAGAGKTSLANLLNVDGINFYEFDRNELFSVTDLTPYMESLFEKAVENQPAVILIDDIDQLQSFCMSEMGCSKLFWYDFMETLFKTPSHASIITVITAENSCQKLDLLEKQSMLLNLFDPSIDDLKLILTESLKNLNIITDIDVDYIASLLPAYNAGEIKELLAFIRETASKNGKNIITKEDIIDGISTITLGKTTKLSPLQRQGLHITAVHEAGHALALMCLNRHDFVSASVLPKKDDIGYVTWSYSDYELRTIENLEEDAIIKLAGRAAEKIVFGKYYANSAFDIGDAYEIIHSLVTCHAAYGFEHLCPKDDSLQPSSRQLITDKFIEFDAAATSLINTHRDIFDKIVALLEEKYMVTAEELLTCFPKDFNFPGPRIDFNLMLSEK